VAQVARPDGCTARGQSQLHGHADFCRLEDGGRQFLGIGERLARGHQLQLTAFALDPQVRARRVNRRAGVPDRGQDAAPVGVPAVEGGLDQRRVSNGFRRAPCILIRCRALHRDRDELRCALAVAHDLPREVGAEVGQRICKPVGIRRPGRAVCQHKQRIVCACVAVDADAVEAGCDRFAQHCVQRIRCDLCIGDHGGQQGCHVRVDHARTFRHAEQPDAVYLAEGDLGPCVGCHNGARGGIPAVWCELRGGRSQPGCDLRHRQPRADDAGGHHRDRTRRQAGRGLCAGGHRSCIGQPALARACICAAGVDRYATQSGWLLGQQAAVVLDWRGGECIACEHSSRIAGPVADDQRQVRRAVLLDARCHTGEAEAVGYALTHSVSPIRLQVQKLRVTGYACGTR